MKENKEQKNIIEWSLIISISIILVYLIFIIPTPSEKFEIKSGEVYSEFYFCGDNIYEPTDYGYKCIKR